MNTLTILFVLPLLVIFSYLFDAFARRTKFPAVILLMLTGILLRVGADASGFENFAFLDNLIPVLGTVGLILIVLEGALELEVGKEKLPIILKGILAAFVILILNIVGITWLLQQLSDMTAQVATIYAIPLSIISSAVAIPSAASLLKQDREFVVYESTFSDILGIMIFNYAIGQTEANQSLIAAGSIVVLCLQIIGVITVSLLITYLLFRLLTKNRTPRKILSNLSDTHFGVCPWKMVSPSCFGHHFYFRDFSQQRQKTATFLFTEVLGFGANGGESA